MRPVARLASLAALALLGVGACTGGGSGGAGATPGGRPQIVVTTTILGDVVTGMLGERAVVSTIMPVGVDPHGFQPSAAQVAAMRAADALVTNGAGFEGALGDVIDGARADGVPVFEAISAVPQLRLGTDDHDGHDDAGHDGPDGPDDGMIDPHFFTDAGRMATAARGIATFLQRTIPALDTDAFRSDVERSAAALEELDATVESTLAVLPEQRRVLVTDHEVFGYFADRYGFRIIGTVIPSGSTSDGVSAADLTRLAHDIEAAGVTAVFTDASAPVRLADTLAAEVGGRVQVVELFSESLGEPGSGGASYAEMMQTNARRIAEALA